MTIFGIIETSNQTVVINPFQIRMVIPQFEQGTPVCYFILDDEHKHTYKVQGTLEEVLGKLEIRTVLLQRLDPRGEPQDRMQRDIRRPE